MKLLRRFRDWLRPALPYLNILLVTGCYWGNQYAVQGFCQPVAWATGVLVPTVLAFLAWPWLARAPQWLRFAAWFLQGLFLTVCLYCAFFMALDPTIYLIGAAFFFLGFPLLVWVPVFFIWQLRRRISTVQLRNAQLVFLAGAFSLTPFYLWAQLQLAQLGQVLADAPIGRTTYVEDLARVWPHTYMAERVLGRIWRYHTSPEFIYDGWRPPLHDPMANLVCWWPGLRSWSRPLPPLSLREQAEVYRLAFPDRPTKPDCVCAHVPDAESFLDWYPDLNDPQSQTVHTGQKTIMELEIPKATPATVK